MYFVWSKNVIESDILLNYRNNFCPVMNGLCADVKSRGVCSILKANKIDLTIYFFCSF